MTYDKATPKIKMSQLVDISEDRIKYSQNYYIKKDFVGFNAIIDKKYFVNVTKLGKILNDFKLTKIKKPNNNTDVMAFTPSDGEDQTFRYIDLSAYPFNTQQIYYYVDGNILNINQSKFYEMEVFSSFFNISYRNKNLEDFGYASVKKKMSFSFIKYNGDLYILNLFSLNKVPYKSLHELCNNK